MDCQECIEKKRGKIKLKIIDFVKSDGTTNRPVDRVVAQCPKCKTVSSIKYDPRDWYTEKQIKVIEKLMRKSKNEVQ